MADVLNISGFDISKFNKENKKIISQLTSNKNSLKLSMVVERPFFFVIFDSERQMILFMRTVEKS